MKNRWNILFVCLLSLTTLTVAAQQKYKVVNITVDDGLINGNIHQIFQDAQGFVWFATENGLVRYDGFDYKIFQTSPNNEHAISHNFVNSVVSENTDYIWIGTMAGVDRYSLLTGTFEHFRFYNRQGNVNMKPALRVFPVSDGCFVQSDDKSVYYAQVGNDTLCEIRFEQFLSNTFVSSMDLVDENHLLVGNKEGKVFLLAKDGKVELLKMGNTTVACVKNLRNNQKCVCYVDGTIEIFNGNTVQKSFKLSNLYDTYINDVEQIDDSVLLIGTRSQGVYELNLQSGIRPFDAPNLINKNCSYLYKDNFENIWIGHSYGGVTLCLSTTYSFENVDFISSDLQNQKILSVIKANGKLFVGTDGGGLYIFDTKTKHTQIFTYETGFQGVAFDNVVTSLSSDGEYVWIGTYNNGVYAYSLKNNAVSFRRELSQCPANDVSAVFADSKHNVWIGTYESGVFVFNKDSLNFIRHYTGYENDGFLNISCDGTTCFFEDNQHQIWIGSYYGISKIKESGESKIYKYDNYPGMRSSVVTSISQTDDSKIWFGSLQGLGFYDNQNDTIIALSNYQTANNMAVCGIVPQADSSMILVTPKYVYMYDPQQNDFRLLSALNKGEMRRNSCFVSPDNLLIGTDFGMKSISLPVENNIDSVHSLRLTDFIVNGESIFSPQWKSEISCKDGVYYLELPYNQKNIRLKFSDFYFDQTRISDFLYKLKGFSDSWVLLHNANEVSYTNLQGGDYVFYAKHLSNDSNSEMEIHIHIAKALWERAEFYVVLVLLLIGVICFWFIRRMQMMVRMKNVLQKQVDLRTQDIQRKTEQIQLQNVQMKLQRDAATRQRSESEMQKSNLEKRLSILLAKIQKNDELISDLKQRTVSLNKEKLLLKRKIDLYENNVRDVVFKILLPSEKIEYVSPSVVQMTGFEDKEFVEGMVSLKDLLTSEIKSQIKQYRAIMLEGRMPEVTEFEIISKDGAKKHICQYARYETNLKGSVIALEVLWNVLEEEKTTSKLIVHAEKKQSVAKKEQIADVPSVEYDWSSYTILVGDSDEESFGYIQECLLPTKINIQRAKDGETLIELFKKSNHISVILLDVQLQKKNGFEVAQTIRNQDKKVPIIAQTLYENYEAKLQCFDAGCDTYIAKPYKHSDLRDLLMKSLDK